MPCVAGFILFRKGHAIPLRIGHVIHSQRVRRGTGEGICVSETLCVLPRNPPLAPYLREFS